MKLYPDIATWDHSKGDITDLGVASSIADLLAGYAISHTAKGVVRDLGLLTKSKESVNKQGRLVLSTYLHGMYHRGKSELVIVNPYEGQSE